MLVLSESFPSLAVFSNFVVKTIIILLCYNHMQTMMNVQVGNTIAQLMRFVQTLLETLCVPVTTNILEMESFVYQVVSHL